jgi:hypothetical protein
LPPVASRAWIRMYEAKHFASAPLAIGLPATLHVGSATFLSPASLAAVAISAGVMSGVPTICSRLMLLLTSLRPARPITMAPTPKTTRMRPAAIPARRSERDIEAPSSLSSSTVP